MFFALFIFLPLSFSFFSLNLETKTPNRVVGRKVEFLDSEAVRVGLESGLERCFFRERERKVSCCRVLSFSVSSLFSLPPHPSHQTRELQDRADNGDEHPEDGETEGDGTAQGGQVAAVHSVGGRRGAAGEDDGGSQSSSTSMNSTSTATFPPPLPSPLPLATRAPCASPALAPWSTPRPAPSFSGPWTLASRARAGGRSP